MKADARNREKYSNFSPPFVDDHLARSASGMMKTLGKNENSIPIESKGYIIHEMRSDDEEDKQQNENIEPTN